jgi:hypothetical protein
MLRPKITIRKKVVLDSLGHYRFFPPHYNPATRIKVKGVTINLDRSSQFNRQGQEYPQVDIRTEKQLVNFLKNNWGYGEYLIFAHLKGREGLFVFWRGELTSDGWIFQAKEYDKKEIVQLEKEMLKADNTEEKAFIEEEIKDFKEMNKEESKTKRYGFFPFLRSSGRRGEWHGWNEDESLDDGIKELNKAPKQNTNKELTIDEINNF